MKKNRVQSPSEEARSTALFCRRLCASRSGPDRRQEHDSMGLVAAASGPDAPSDLRELRRVGRNIESAVEAIDAYMVVWAHAWLINVPVDLGDGL